MKVNTQSIIHPYIFTILCKDVGMDKGLLYFHLVYAFLVCVIFWHAISTSLFIFNDFSFLVTYTCKHALMVHQTIFLVRR